MRIDSVNRFKFIDKKSTYSKQARANVKNRSQRMRVGPKINTPRETEISWCETDEKNCEDEYEE